MGPDRALMRHYGTEDIYQLKLAGVESFIGRLVDDSPLWAPQEESGIPSGWDDRMVVMASIAAHTGADLAKEAGIFGTFAKAVTPAVTGIGKGLGGVAGGVRSGVAGAAGNAATKIKGTSAGLLAKAKTVPGQVQQGIKNFGTDMTMRGQTLGAKIEGKLTGQQLVSDIPKPKVPGTV